MVVLTRVLAYVLVFFINYAGHWFPWDTFRFLCDEHNVLKRPFAYIHGTLSIILGFTLAVVTYGHTVSVGSAVYALCWAVIAAGMGTLIPYGIDALRDMDVLRKDVESYEQTIKGR